MSPSLPDPTNPPGTDPERSATETAFNAWLDATFTERTAAPEPPGSPGAIAARSLQALAADEDAALVSATAAAPWKEILVSSHSHPIAATPAPDPIPARPALRLSRFGSTVNRLVSIAAILAVLLAGFATAWIARDRFGSDNEAPVLQLAASPTSSSTFTCTTKTLSQEEVDRTVEDYRKRPPKSSSGDDPTITDKPVAKADAEAAIAVWRAFYSCPDGEPGTDQTLWKTNVWADPDSQIVGQRLMTDPAFMAEAMKQSKAALEPMSRTFTPLTPADYIVDSNDPAIKPYVFTPSAYVGTIAMLPDRFVTLSDGRIGSPILKAYPGGAAAYNNPAALSVLTVGFIIFSKVDGQWLMSGALTLCPGDCSQMEQRLDVYIDYYTRLSTVIGSPVASPDAVLPATPAASPKP